MTVRFLSAVPWVCQRPGSWSHGLPLRPHQPALRIFRQAAQSQIVRTAHRIKDGAMPERYGKEAGSDFYFLQRRDPEQIRNLLVDLLARRIPTSLAVDRIRDIQVLCPMNRGSIGARELNATLQA